MYKVKENKFVVVEDNKKNEMGLTKQEWLDKIKETHNPELVGEFIWKKKKIEQPKYIPEREMEHIKKFPSILRDSNAIFEEKVDGSNMCFVNETQADGTMKMKFYSRNWELDYNNPATAFWKPFIDFILEQHAKVPFEPDLEYFGEAIGQAHIPYFNDKKNIDTKLRYRLFDIRDMKLSKKLGRDYWFRWETIKQLAEKHGLLTVPVIEIENIDNRTSQVDSNVEREGFISLHEMGDEFRTKIKHVEVDLKGHGYQPSLNISFNPNGTYDTKENKQIIRQQQEKYKNAWMERDKANPDKLNIYNQGVKTAGGKYKKVGWYNIKTGAWSVANINMLIKNRTLKFIEDFKTTDNADKFFDKPEDND